MRILTLSLALVAGLGAHAAPDAKTPAAATVEAASEATPAESAVLETRSASRASVREQAIAGRLVVLAPGVEQRWLETDAAPFLSLHRPADLALPHGGLIINAAPGTVVDHAPVLRRIAERAASGGWSVLSIQQIGIDGMAADAAARIGAAFNAFIAEGIQNIVIVSDAQGTSAALASLTMNRSPAAAGFVALGPWSGDPGGLEISILDIAGTRDPAALTAQTLRRAAAREYSKPVEFLQIHGADAKFYGYEDEVAARVLGWLNRAMPSVALRR